jgi:hypothetical protein
MKESLTSEMRNDLSNNGVTVICKMKDCWAAYRRYEALGGRIHYNFGRVYYCGTFAHYEVQGCEIFDNLAECVAALCKFFGIRINIEF